MKKQHFLRNLFAGMLIIPTLMIMTACSEDNVLTGSEIDPGIAGLKSAKEAPTLVGIQHCEFSFDHPPVFWTGTVDFGDGNIYGIKFISYDAPRAFSQASPFYEDFIIYDLADGTVYLKGWDKGVVTYANKDPEPVKYNAMGKVMEAYGPLETWLGRTAHFQGIVNWVDVGIPESIEGTFRLN